MNRTTRSKPALAAYAWATVFLTGLLLYAGGFTTTIQAGMVFPDWPLSNGSLNPEGWLHNQAMLAEHSHRLLGMTIGLLVTILAVWMHRREGRLTDRRLAWAALGLVAVQGLLGGLRVLHNSVPLAAVHGCVAQLFLALLAILAARQTPSARATPSPAPPGARGLTLACVALLVVQMVVAAIMRHSGAGLAIPTFPLTPEGTFLPVQWNGGVAWHFAHRLLGYVLLPLMTTWAWAVLRAPGLPPSLRRLAWAVGLQVWLQVALGIGVVLAGRTPILTTLHVLNGAYLMAASLTLAWWLHRSNPQPASVTAQDHRLAPEAGTSPA